MAAKRRARTKSEKWWKSLDSEEVRAAFVEATVDAYGEDEQHTGLLTAIEDELAFPFSARLLGDVIDVVGMQWPDDDPFGLDLVCERNGHEHRVDARSVELIQPLPEGAVFLAAYLDWRSRL